MAIPQTDDPFARWCQLGEVLRVGGVRREGQSHAWPPEAVEAIEEVRRRLLRQHQEEQHDLAMVVARARRLDAEADGA